MELRSNLMSQSKVFRELKKKKKAFGSLECLYPVMVKIPCRSDFRIYMCYSDKNRFVWKDGRKTETGTVAKCLFHFVASHVSQRLNIGCRSKYHGTFAKEANTGFSDVQNQLLIYLVFFLIFLKDSIIFLPTHFPSIKAGENKVEEGIRMKRKAFPLGWRWERNRKANSCWGAAQGQNLCGMCKTLASLSSMCKAQHEKSHPRIYKPQSWLLTKMGLLPVLSFSFPPLPASHFSAFMSASLHSGQIGNFPFFCSTEPGGTLLPKG